MNLKSQLKLFLATSIPDESCLFPSLNDPNILNSPGCLSVSYRTSDLCECTSLSGVYSTTGFFSITTKLSNLGI